MHGAYQRLLQHLRAGSRGVLITTLSSGSVSLWLEEHSHDVLNADAAIMAKRALQSGRPIFVPGLGAEPLLIEPFFPESKLVILGGGHVAQSLADIAGRSGFSVTVVDDRPAFADTARFPMAEQVLCAGFPGCVSSLGLNTATFLVIVTRGHRHDLECLRATLDYPLAYIGMIGSRRRVKVTKEQLLAEGFGQEQLDRLHAPIGVDIGAVTPAEIAIAILAELIAVKRGKETAREAPLWPDNDLQVLAELARQSEQPRALITVTAAKGSTPRGVGAKMLVWPDGRTLGSIGGGCNEAEAIGIARDLLRAGADRYRIHHLDLTAALAAEEGMVCGGSMQVLAQAIPADGLGPI